jgi:hypothetical protein
MDFQDERYVRLYVRDTLTWKDLGWEGRQLLVLLLRRVDRSGILEIGTSEPAAAAARLEDMPIAVARLGMRRMFELGVAEHRGRCLVFPRFMEAQESTKSDRLRQRESRERRLQKALSQQQLCLSQKVTTDVGIVEESSTCHEMSRVDKKAQLGTGSGSDLSSPEQPPPIPENTNAPSPKAAPPLSIVRFRSDPGEAPPDAEPIPPEPWLAVLQQYRAEYAKRRPGLTGAWHKPSAVKLVEWCQKHAATVYKTDPRTLATKIIDGLFGCPKAAENGWPIGWAAHDPTQFLKAHRGRSNFRPGAVSTKDEIARQAADNPAWIDAEAAQ